MMRTLLCVDVNLIGAWLPFLGFKFTYWHAHWSALRVGQPSNVRMKGKDKETLYKSTLPTYHYSVALLGIAIATAESLLQNVGDKHLFVCSVRYHGGPSISNKTLLLPPHSYHHISLSLLRGLASGAPKAQIWAIIEELLPSYMKEPSIAASFTVLLCSWRYSGISLIRFSWVPRQKTYYQKITLSNTGSKRL